MTDRGTSWVQVRLVGLPVEIHRRYGEHQEALRRELALIEHAHAADAAPARLQALGDELTGRYGALTETQTKQLLEATEAGRTTIDLEFELIKPKLAVALGATAAVSLLGRVVPVMKMRGQVIEREDGLRVFVTIHPSLILRIREPADKEAERERFLQDMKQVKRLMAA